MPPATDKPAISALVLLSGGLDSRLAASLLKAQGIRVTGLSFETRFFSAAKARAAADQLGLPMRVEPFADDLLAIIEHPRHGFGSHMNPCIDCHTAMLRRAGRIMERDGFHLIATGEVLNQRPMSQTRRSLEMVAAESGYKDWILRPLSARLLPETEPERRGWVDRGRLLDLNGRSRKPQMKLAEQYGITDYPPPAGGCRLTEPNYAARLKDLRDHRQVKDLHAIALLRVGRHFRINDRVKAIVGRDASDNAAIEAAAGPEEALLAPEEVPGPTVLVAGAYDESDLAMAGALCARYSDAAPGQVVTLSLKCAGVVTPRTAVPLPPGEADRLRIK